MNIPKRLWHEGPQFDTGEARPLQSVRSALGFMPVLLSARSPSAVPTSKLCPRGSVPSYGLIMKRLPQRTYALPPQYPVEHKATTPI